jgi:hypothetical protein
VRLLWLPDVLDGAGLEVEVLPGWETSGRPWLRPPEGVVWHHDATPPRSNPRSVAQMIQTGHARLRGPLSQISLDRRGVWWVVASGVANHAGAGALPWNGERGNTRTVGIEASNDGLGERWPDHQVDSYIRGTAAILRHLGHDQTRLTTHHAYAPGRKIDPAGPSLIAPEGGTWPLAACRAEVARHLGDDVLTTEQARKLDELHLALVQMVRDEFPTPGGLPHNIGRSIQQTNGIVTQWDVDALAERIADSISTDLDDSDVFTIGQVIREDIAERIIRHD